jgi:3-keto-5-aminohexanoate cleavage enzyme
MKTDNPNPANPARPADAWLEVALNGSWNRKRQPLVPVTPAEIVAEGIACAREGAAIVHYHAFDTERGAPSDDLDLHRRIIEGIREQVDALVYPTTVSRKLRLDETDAVTGRFDLARGLAAHGLLDALVIDPGAHLMFDPLERWSPYIYANFIEDIDEALALCRNCGAAASFAIYEPGYARVGAYRARAADLPVAPIHRAMFSDTLLYGLPPGDAAIAAYASLFAGLGTRWMMAGLDYDISPWLPAALEAGADVRVGLEDAPHGCAQGNVQQVRAATEAVARSGRRLADAAGIRASLGAPAGRDISRA